MLEKFQHAENNFENFKHAVGKTKEVEEIEKSGEKKISGKYQFTFGKGASFKVRCARLFSGIAYHWSACPGELDEAELSTFRHTFFVFFFLLDVAVRCSGWGNGAPQVACPSLSYCIRKHCSSLCFNLKNMSSLPTRKWISPLPTSILALGALKNGPPSMSSTLRSPFMSITTKLARTKESRTRTKTFSIIPLGYQIVESASCTSTDVGERAGY